MRKIFTLYAFLYFAINAYSQEEILPKDESGNYAIYEIVEINGYSQETLLNNAEAFLKYYVNKKYKKALVTNREAGEVNARSGFLVYKRGSFGRNVDGAIEYAIKIEGKEGKYRYLLSDFVFQEYERNRYGKFQPVTGKYRPLEHPSSDLNKGQWEEHKKTIKGKMELLTGELKLYMLRKPGQPQEKVKVKQEW